MTRKKPTKHNSKNKIDINAKMPAGIPEVQIDCLDVIAVADWLASAEGLSEDEFEFLAVARDQAVQLLVAGHRIVGTAPCTIQLLDALVSRAHSQHFEEPEEWQASEYSRTLH